MRRRDFLAGASVAGLSAPGLVSAAVFGANERLDIGVIGVGGRGAGDRLFKEVHVLNLI